MSEIIFPQELAQPYELDWNNPLVTELTANGVDIFITDDNLITVTNVTDGTSGTPTDITSNEQGVVLNDYRVGVDTSSLTAQQQNDVNSNPYQLFKTAEIKRDEYGLGIAQYSGTAITFPRLTFNAADQWFEIKFSNYNFTGNNGTQCSIAFASNFGTDFRINNINRLSWSSFRVSKVELDGVEVPTGTVMPLDGQEHTLRIYTTNTTAWLEGLFNNIGSPFLLTLTEVSASSVEGNYLWVFNRQDSPTTIADEYNDSIATINSSPLFERVIELQSFDTNDYATIASLNSAENSQAYEVSYDVLGNISGGTLTGFASGLRITSSNTSEVTTPLTLTTTGYTLLSNITLDDVDATGATEVYITNCEAQNVTG